MGKPDQKKVLLLIPHFSPAGGGEAVAAWTLQSLRKEYDLSVLTWANRVDIDEINRVYGTSLVSTDYKLLGPPLLLRTAFELALKWKPQHKFQKACLLYRLARWSNDRYDIMISTQDEVDFGRRGIQYVHYPSFIRAYQLEREAYYRWGTSRAWQLFRQRCRPWRILSGLRFEGLRENLTVVNSDWTGAVVRQLYCINTTTIYPPVAGEFPAVPWSERRDRFVCIGRFVQHKRMEIVIEILTRVRAEGYELELYIIGLQGEDVGSHAYRSMIENLTSEHRPWVSVVEKIDRGRLVDIVSHSRYGIHAAEEEPFGIAVAEMVKGGCVTFAGRNGGQAEIVGSDERLMFNTVEEGVRKIIAVLRNPGEQTALREHLAGLAPLFGTDRFEMEIRGAVRALQAEQSNLDSGKARPTRCGRITAQIDASGV